MAVENLMIVLTYPNFVQLRRCRYGRCTAIDKFQIFRGVGYMEFFASLNEFYNVDKTKFLKLKL